MKRRVECLLLMFVFVALSTSVKAADMRRPISPQQPMWLIHIDTWNYPDPERIIELIPKDILPYCVFNISLSASDNVCISGPNVCDSWLKACAAKRVWCMVQCASGAHSRFSDFDLTYYERYFNEYPNFIGWNFAEQFWGFGEDGCPTFPERLALFGEILKICNRYGGYLVVSFTQAEYSADMMPIAYMKRNAIVNEQLTKHPENFICCEKYTMKRGFFEIESNCLGAYLGGYAGQYGIRFDECGWATTDEDGEPFVTASGAIPIAEHVMLTGETVIDGPELIWRQDTKETNRISTTDGYMRRNWDFFPQFVNINIDLFRKILDGTIRILSRSEVIDRTKICVVNDERNGNFGDYTSPASMFHGLYRQDYDGSVDNPIATNIWWMKKSGRYPTFPQVYGLLDEQAQRLEAVKKSEYNRRWPTVQDKVAEFNRLFPKLYDGDIYAANAENRWVIYNPYQYEHSSGQVHISSRRSWGSIPPLYNSAEEIEMNLAPYSLLIMNEFSDSISLYLTNYRTTSSGGEYAQQSDTIYIKGVDSEPLMSWFDRGRHTNSKVTASYSDGTYKIVVKHNGPVEIALNCKGSAPNRLTNWTPAELIPPAAPPIYNGTRQYEGEFFDYKGGASITTNGYYSSYKNYYGQGYMTMGTNSSAMVRDTIYVESDGIYTIGLRYLAPNGQVTVKTTLNGVEERMQLSSTFGNTWKWKYADFALKSGANVVTIQFASSLTSQLLIDCLSVSGSEEVSEGWMSLSASSVAVPSMQYGNSPTSATLAVTYSFGDEIAVSFKGDEPQPFVVDLVPKSDNLLHLQISLSGDLAVGDYTDTLQIWLNDKLREVPVSGSVTPGAYQVEYSFESETARTSYKNPPATDIKVGYQNGATAGVVNYTDNAGTKSKMLKIYSANSSRHATGVLNLNRFTSYATDYSVTWRQVITSSNIAHKNGVLLRGDTKKVGNSSRGYTQGMYAGYYISVYNHGTATDIRVYKSTTASNLSMLTQKGIELSVSPGMSVWYRASVVGANKAQLKLEYSTDGKNWKSAITTTDESEPFQMGATQFVWGLDSSHDGFVIDDIAFNGITYDPVVTDVLPVQQQPTYNQMVYDIFGREVGTAESIEQLAPGVYIIGGKKFIVW